MPDCRGSCHVQPHLVGRDSRHYADSTTRLDGLLPMTREDYNDARLIVNRKVAAIVTDMSGVYNWKQRCIRIHPERFFLNDGVHLMWVSLETVQGGLWRSLATQGSSAGT